MGRFLKPGSPRRTTAAPTDPDPELRLLLGGSTPGGPQNRHRTVQRRTVPVPGDSSAPAGGRGNTRTGGRCYTKAPRNAGGAAGARVVVPAGQCGLNAGWDGPQHRGAQPDPTGAGRGQHPSPWQRHGRGAAAPLLPALTASRPQGCQP